MTKKWVISFAIDGSGTAGVEADTIEEAMQKFNNGECVVELECTEWNVNTSDYRGGYVEAQEVDEF